MADPLASTRQSATATGTMERCIDLDLPTMAM
jgi:hypothetical protein